MRPDEGRVGKLSKTSLVRIMATTFSEKPADEFAARAIEKEFEDRLAMFLTEIDTVNQFFFSYMAIHGEFETIPLVTDMLRRYSLVFNTLTGSLQTSLFIAVGRIFDESAEHSLQRLRGFASRNRWIFDKDRLRIRKEALGGRGKPWLDSFIDKAIVPDKVVFRELKKAVTQHETMYREKLEPIRNKWFAHREIMPLEASYLWLRTSINEIETLMSFLTEYYRVLFRLYYDGSWGGITHDVYTYQEMQAHPEEHEHYSAIQRRSAGQMQMFLREAAGCNRQ